jgi:hypothetical protein
MLYTAKQVVEVLLRSHPHQTIDAYLAAFYRYLKTLKQNQAAVDSTIYYRIIYMVEKQWTYPQKVLVYDAFLATFGVPMQYVHDIAPDLLNRQAYRTLLHNIVLEGLKSGKEILAETLLPVTQGVNYLDDMLARLRQLVGSDVMKSVLCSSQGNVGLRELRRIATEMKVSGATTKSRAELCAELI